MRIGLGGAHDVEHRDAASHERIGDHRAVTTPGDCFGAHDGGGAEGVEREELVEVLGKFRGLHMVGIPAEGVVAPAGIGGVLPRVAESTETGKVTVLDPRISEGGGQGIPVELRVIARLGDGSDIDQMADAVGEEKVEEVPEGTVGMTDGEQTSYPCAGRGLMITCWFTLGFILGVSDILLCEPRPDSSLRRPPRRRLFPRSKRTFESARWNDCTRDERR